MKKLLQISAISAAITLSGCATHNAYTGEQQTSKAAWGAGIGAVTGALIGNRSGKAGEGALLGGIVGGLIGYSMDSAEDELRQKLENTGVSVQKTHEGIQLIMPDATFASGQAQVSPQFYDVLQSVAIVLKKFDEGRVRVSGHTDDVGSEIANQTLSEQRAESVTDYLVSQDVPRQRFEVKGFGERRPIASNGSETGRMKNRRVEIDILN